MLTIPHTGGATDGFDITVPHPFYMLIPISNLTIINYKSNIGLIGVNLLEIINNKRTTYQ